MRMLAIPLLLLVAACGRESQAATGTVYVMGDAAKAREQATRAPDPATDNLTLAELAERREPLRLDLSIHLLLDLHDDGTFAYYGPLKMGDDAAITRGRWSCSGEAVELRLDPPRTSKDEVISVLRCPLVGGILDYPMGRGPGSQVYYRMTEASRADGRTPVIRIGSREETPR